MVLNTRPLKCRSVCLGEEFSSCSRHTRRGVSLSCQRQLGLSVCEGLLKIATRKKRREILLKLLYRRLCLSFILWLYILGFRSVTSFLSRCNLLRCTTFTIKARMFLLVTLVFRLSLKFISKVSLLALYTLFRGSASSAISLTCNNINLDSGPWTGLWTGG